MPDHEVIEDVNVQQFARLYDGARNGNVIRRGRWVSGGMVVDHHDGGSIASNGGLKYLAYADLG